MIGPDERRVIGPSTRIDAASRVRLVPWLMRHQGERALVGQANGSGWIELDAIGADVLERLDQGLTIEEAQQQLVQRMGRPVDVLAFARDLDALGFVAASEGEHASSRVNVPDVMGRPSWIWHLFVLCSAAATGYLIWAVASGAHVISGGADLLVRGLPLDLALTLLALLVVVILLVHEMSHVLVARLYGLSPRVDLSRRGLWIVAETGLTGVWALPRSIQWRPIAAGLMADVSLLAANVLCAQVAGPHAVITPYSRMATAVLLAQMLWQFQWYLRTDVYFLLSVGAGVPNLRETAWLWVSSLFRKGSTDTRHARLAIDAIPRRDVMAARAYLISLLAAAVASAVLWVSMLQPLVLAVARSVGV